MRRIHTLAELKEIHSKGLIGNGTFSTGKYALEQGKPLFIKIVEEDANNE